LQWGFPIATPLSLIKPPVINGKEKKETHPSQWVGLKAFNKSGRGWKAGLAKRRALFPEGRGLGVGGRKRK